MVDIFATRSTRRAYTNDISASHKTRDGRMDIPESHTTRDGRVYIPASHKTRCKTEASVTVPCTGGS